jgi:acyl-CoA thioesterase
MTGKQAQAEQVAARMLRDDAFSQWLGIEVVAVSPGAVTLRMTVRGEMMNCFGVCHGGIPFSFADTALAFASNSHGRLSLALDANITYPAKILEGDLLTATAEEMNLGGRAATYNIIVTKQDGTTVGLFRGTVYRTKQMLIPEEIEDS